jgi:2-(1,2-epoxy-1,2-dihydrophenyl)acetyl-CoA isomerase
VSYLAVEDRGAIAIVKLDRPQSRNAISSFEDCAELVDCLVRLDADRAKRAIILTGADPAFCAGGDLKQMRAGTGLGGGRTALEVQDNYRRGVQRIPLAFQAIDIPIVAAVNGPAVGVGCDLAAMCDLRIASERATFAESFVKVGLVPGDGGAWFLARAIGVAAAARMALTGETIPAERARSIGLVSDVVPHADLMQAAIALAEAIAANPPAATRRTKRLLREALALPLPAFLDLTSGMQAALHHSDDHKEAVTAILEKRPPSFTGS